MNGRRIMGWVAWGLCLVLAAAGALAAEEPVEPFYFVQISDTHWGARDGVTLTRRFVRAVNALPMKIEFVVHTGDLFADNIDKEDIVRKGKDAMLGLTVPVHYVAGNHDLPEKILGSAALFQKHIGPLASAAEYRGVVFLFLCVEPLFRERGFGGYDPLPWLAGQLKKYRGRPVVLCQHSPPVGDFHDNAIHPGWPARAAQAWEDLLSPRQVRAVITGHFHRDELHWIGEIPVYVGSPVARFWDRQPSFRLYEYRGGRLGYRMVPIEEKPDPATEPKDEDPRPAGDGAAGSAKRGGS